MPSLPFSPPLIAIFVATSGHSGVDRLVGHLIPGFAALGYRVDVLQVRGHGPHVDTLPPGVRCIDLGAAHVSTSLPSLVRYLRRARPTVLLSDKYRVNRVALIARWLARVPTRVAVRTGTTVSVDLASRSAWQRLTETAWMRALYPHADAVITPSQGAAQDLARLACLPSGRVQAVPSPLLAPGLPARAAEAVDHPWFTAKDRPVILGAGELCSRKDFATLIRAYAAVRHTRPARLVILGEGRARGRLEALIAELGLTEEVALPGRVQNPYAYMVRADVFVSSSIWEGFGNVIAEALAVGTPVVATDCPSGPREILDDGRHGRLVPIGDYQAMAQAILATLDHRPDPAQLQAAAAPYQVAQATRAYLTALGLCPTDIGSSGPLSL